MMMAAAVPAVMMTAPAGPAIVMAASAMMAHMAMPMASMTALHLHDCGIGQRAARHQRHCRCGSRGGCEHDCDQPSLNKPFHWILPPAAHRGKKHKCPGRD